MGKHIHRQKIHHYLDGTLSTSERQAVWAHLQTCTLCYARLREEETTRTTAKREFVGFAKRDDLTALLPGILAETRRTPLSQHPLTIMATVFMVLVAFVPLIPRFSTATYAHDADLLNVPLSTQAVPMQERATLEAADSDSEFIETAFNMEYASPVPYPQATANGSPSPKNSE